MASHLEWIATTFGMWYTFVRLKRYHPLKTLCTALAVHLGVVMLAGGVTPVDLFEFLLQQTYYYSRKPRMGDPGTPVAILILLLRLSNPEMFVGKLSRWWPLACSMLFCRPILFVCRLIVDVHNYLLVESSLDEMYKNPTAFASHLVSSLFLSILIASFWRDVRISMASYVSAQQSPPTTADPTVASPIILAPGHFPVTPPSMKQPASPPRVNDTNVKPNSDQCPQELNRNVFNWEGERTASSATSRSALKRNARTPLQLDVNFEDPGPSLRSPPPLSARLSQGLRSPRYIPKLSLKHPPSPPSRDNNYQVPSVEDEEHDRPKIATATPTYQRRAWRYSNDDDDVTPHDRDVTPRSPNAAKQNHNGESAVPTAARAPSSHFEGDGDDEDPWRAAAIMDLTGLESKLGLFWIEVHQLQATGEQRSATGADHHDRLISDIKQDVLGKLKGMELGGADDLRQFRDSLVDEAERLLDALYSLKPISLDSPMVVDDSTFSGKHTFTQDVQQILRMDDCDHESSENRRKGHEAVLTEVEKVLKRCDKEIGRLARIDEMDLPPHEKDQCSCAIRELEDALRNLEDIEIHIDSDLEQSRKPLMGSVKTLINTFRCLRGDFRSHDNTEAARRKMGNTQQSEQSAESNSPRSDNPLYVGPKTAFTVSFKIPGIVQRVHRQCKAFEAHPPHEGTPNSTFEVNWVCEHLVWTSRFVDLLSKVANDDDLERLPDKLFGPTPQMLQDISRVLRALRQDYKLLVDQGLPCVRNIQTKLESFHRRRQAYQKWLKGRKVHFSMVVDPPPS